MIGAQSVAKAFPEYPTTIVRVYPPAVHLKDYISMAGPEVMTVGKSEGAQKTFVVINCLFNDRQHCESVSNRMTSSVSVSVSQYVCNQPASSHWYHALAFVV